MATSQSALRRILFTSLRVLRSAQPVIHFWMWVAYFSRYLNLKHDTQEWEAQSAQVKKRLVVEFLLSLALTKFRQTGRSASQTMTEKSPLVIDIDVDDDTPNLQLRYDVGDDVQQSARRFVEENSLPPSYIQRIAQFLSQATEGVKEEVKDKQTEEQGREDIQTHERKKSKKSSIKRLAEILTSSTSR